jgi:hypothetical protein
MTRRVIKAGYSFEACREVRPSMEEQLGCGSNPGVFPYQSDLHGGGWKTGPGVASQRAVVLECGGSVLVAKGASDPPGGTRGGANGLRTGAGCLPPKDQGIPRIGSRGTRHGSEPEGDVPGICSFLASAFGF